MVRFYTDENVRGAIVRGLRRRGVDVLTVLEDGRERAPDPEVLDRATALGRVLYTEDEDLLREAQQRQVNGIVFVGVIYGHQERLPIGRCIEDLQLIVEAGQPEEYENMVQYLPL
jgi:hypothetical protein